MKNQKPEHLTPHTSHLTGPVPWQGGELKHFWALIRANGLSADDVAAITAQKSKASIRDLTRHEWLEILWELRRRNDPHYGCSQAEWDRIKWLQHELGWSDKHLENYIKKHGHIDRVEWLCSYVARKVMYGMEKTLGYVPKSGKDNKSANRETKGAECETE